MSSHFALSFVQCVNSEARLHRVIKMTAMFVEPLEGKIEALNGFVEEGRGREDFE